MQNRQVEDGRKRLKEQRAVMEYKLKSEIYKKMLECADECQSDGNIKLAIDLNKADTFAELLNVANKFNPREEGAFINGLAKSFVTISSFFNTEANFVYYYQQLKDDITQAANRRGYIQFESKVSNNKY